MIDFVNYCSEKIVLKNPLALFRILVPLLQIDVRFFMISGLWFSGLQLLCSCDNEADSNVFLLPQKKKKKNQNKINGGKVQIQIHHILSIFIFYLN